MNAISEVICNIFGIIVQELRCCSIENID